MEDVFWYYLDAARRRQGPVDAQQIRGALHNREIGADALAWREGMDAWKPLREIAEFAEFAAAFPDARDHVPGHAPGLLGPDTVADPFDIVHAGFWRRWAALCIDQLMILVPLLGLTVLFGFLGGAFRNMARDGLPDVSGLYYFLYFLIAPLYFALQESGRHQATLGKRALGIKVADLDGKPLGFGHALLRWLASGLSWLTFGLGFLLAAFTTEKKALHDLVVRTQVVDQWAYSAHPERQQRGLSGCLIVFMVLVALSVPALGIVAAIALPAYTQYVARAKGAGNPMLALFQMREKIERFHEEEGRCPSYEDDGFGGPDGTGSVFDRIEVGTAPGGACAMILHVRDRANAHLIMEYHPSTRQWTCSSQGLPEGIAPAHCR